jgi:hypothetical protein
LIIYKSLKTKKEIAQRESERIVREMKISLIFSAFSSSAVRCRAVVSQEQAASFTKQYVDTRVILREKAKTRDEYDAA